jgi:hypothetical protein
MLRSDVFNGTARWLGSAVLCAALTVSGCGAINERSEFTGLVMGKSGDEVIAKVGKPAAIDASNPAQVVWTFRHATFDLANQNREDGTTLVTLEPKGTAGDLVVADVKFVP